MVEPTLLEKRLYEICNVYDAARKGEVDVRDLGTIIRALGYIKHKIQIILYLSHSVFYSFFLSFNRMCHYGSRVARDTSRSRRCRK